MTAWSLPGYTHVAQLVRDTSGWVMLARHDGSGTAVAIRYVSAASLTEPGSGPRLSAHTALLATLDDPHLARPRECAESEFGVAIVRDLVDGISLHALLVEEGAVSPEAALVALDGSLRGLAAAHGVGVVHRDLRPGTAFVAGTGDVTLVDIGIASRAGREPTDSPAPFYLAPEQWAGTGPGPSADLYAATATFFECLVGAPPYYGDDAATLRDRHESAAVPVEAVPAPLRELVGRGLAKRPQERPATAVEFLAEVEVAAAQAYGAGWRDRGRAELARLAAGPQAAFPLDPATVAGRAPAAVAPRRTRSASVGRIVAAAAVAVALGIGLAGVLPSDAPADERGSSTWYDRADSPQAGAVPSRERAVPSGVGAVPPASNVGPLPGVPAPGAQPLAPQTGRPAPGVEQPRALPPTEGAAEAPATRSTAGSVTGAGPTPLAAPPTGSVQVTGLSIESFSQQGPGTRLLVHVDTNRPDPVQLLIGYGSGRRDDIGSTAVRTMTRELAGHTSYAVVDERQVAGGCADYWTVAVWTTPAAGGEVPVRELFGVPCGG